MYPLEKPCRSSCWWSNPNHFRFDTAHLDPMFAQITFQILMYFSLSFNTLNIIILRSIHVVACNKSSFFLSLSSTPLHRYIIIYFSIYLLINIRVVSRFWYYKWSCYENSLVSLCMNICFHFSWVNIYLWNVWIMWLVHR